MIEMIIAIGGVFTVGFISGYAVRSRVSHKRRVEYLRHAPYLPKSAARQS